MARLCFTGSLTWLGFDYLTQPVWRTPTTGVNRDEKSDQRKHAAQRWLAFNNRGKGLNGLVNAWICPQEKRNEQKILADAGTGHVGGALERDSTMAQRRCSGRHQSVRCDRGG